jgi:CRISPR/Cas system CMR-associated protein Cmr5 small subunit
MKNIKINLQFIIFILIIINVIFLFTFFLKNETIDRRDYKGEINAITKINDSLLIEIKNYKIQIKEYEQEISYLGNQKEKVIIKYKTKVDEIEKLSNNSLVNEFDSIFAKFNIK